MAGKKKNQLNRYSQIIEKIFLESFQNGMEEVPFTREDLTRVAREMEITLPKNLGDILYTFRYRGILPKSIRDKAPKGKHWIIRPAGRAKYCFAITRQPIITPNQLLAAIKIPDSTPGIIEKYAFSDEQALLAKVRYNRLIDIFTGVACYSLQSHLRTSVRSMGQVETDEIYIGVNQRGEHFVFPVQAKGGKDRLSVVQIEQDQLLCSAKFPDLICRAIATQFIEDDLIALFEFIQNDDGEIAIAVEKHYRLVPPDDITPDDLKQYRALSP